MVCTKLEYAGELDRVLGTRHENAASWQKI